MNFDDLHAFTQVARHGGYGRAAAHMRVAQSAISRRIARLQHDLGVPLFERIGRGVQLTPAGQHLHRRAEGLMRELMLIEREVADRASEPMGVVRIGFPPTVGQMIAPLVAVEIAQRFPRIKLALREGHLGTIHNWLVDGELDLSLLYNPEAGPHVRIATLLDEPLFLIGADTPEMTAALPADGAPIARTDLQALPLILPHRSHSIRRYLDRLAAERGLDFTIAYEVEGMQMTKSLVRAGLGFTIFSQSSVFDDVGAGIMRTTPIAPPLSWRLELVKHTGVRPTAAVETVSAMIVDQVRALHENGVFVGRWRGDAPPGLTR